MIDEVTHTLVRAAEIAITPRFRRLTARDVAEKAPGDLVTIADHEAEQLISHGLREILDIPVVGEEAAAEDPSLLAELGKQACWLVDPIDGTSNFVAGRSEYAVMAALLRNGQPEAGWIILPESGRRYVAERGSGAFRDGVRLHRPPPLPEAGRLRGAAPTRRLTEQEKTQLSEVGKRFASFGPGALSAGVNYTRLLDGHLDFVLYQRSLPWDHAAGTLLLSEAGGITRRPDGKSYRPTQNPINQLLNAADHATWEAVRAVFWHN
ncbi:inositol monophosphatase family protein [Nocardia sp. NPDC005825]|uniref:inositol monophosphatase family protein n=1 Tax=unclassified Nocardia TaxID=2637762 RepID=UPI0033F95A2C